MGTLSIVLIVYGVLCVVIGLLKPPFIWNMKRFQVMEKSAASQELNSMMTNIENNGAPWQYNQMDRLNWKDE